jgi:hypothetical protein
MFAHAVLGLAILPVMIFFLRPTIGVDRAAGYPPLYATKPGLKSKTCIHRTLPSLANKFSRLKNLPFDKNIDLWQLLVKPA